MSWSSWRESASSLGLAPETARRSPLGAEGGTAPPLANTSVTAGLAARACRSAGGGRRMLLFVTVERNEGGRDDAADGARARGAPDGPGGGMGGAGGIEDGVGVLRCRLVWCKQRAR